MSCPDCFTGTIHTYASPTGHFSTLHNLRTYITLPSPSSQPTKPTSSTSNSNSNSSTIIFLTDAFGFNLVNSLLLADRYRHETGYRVLIPDIIPGGGVPISTFSLMEIVTTPVSWWDVWGQVKRVLALVKMLFVVVPFARRTKDVFPTILEFVRAVKNEGDVKKIGVAGVGEEGEVDRGRLVDACFVAHPAGLKPAQFVEGVKRFGTPFSMAVGDRDFVLNRSGVEEIEAGLRREFGDGIGEVKWEVEMDGYKGCGHGFAVRADEKKVIEREGAEKAVEQAVRWFKLNL